MKKIILFCLLLVLQVGAQTFDSQDQNAISANIKFLRKSLKSASEDKVLKIAKYLAHLQLTPQMKNYEKDVTRLLESSTQFILCDNIEDLTCLESTPLIKPILKSRVDALAGLGKPVKAGKSLNIEYYFTEGWFDNYGQKQKNYQLPKTSVADKLAEKIKNPNVKALYFAMYGIDDLKATMAPVFNAIEEKVKSNVTVKTVVDIEKVEKGKITFAYDGTSDFLNLLGKDMGHTELPYGGIMHNKFVVFETADDKSVWSGTANFSRTCMGSEENANMSIYIKNADIAQAFKDEFTEMFKPVVKDKETNLMTGVFHNKKTPNSRRYFVFEDGTEVRVHFSPTDDAEHKVILPMLYSARSGDILRISMFGSGGYELVRALQAAAARGVEIRIAVDTMVGAGTDSWLKNDEANLLDKNPYGTSNKIEIRKNGWSPSLNHHKTATLTRKLSNGYRPEMIIIGSQNWSDAGNDKNDENVVSISNKKNSLEIMEAYNQHFDEKIWKASVPIK